MSTDTDDRSARLLKSIEKMVSQQQWELWFSKMTVISAEGDRVLLAVTNPFVRDWLATYYMEVLQRAVVECCGPTARPDLILLRAGTGNADESADAEGRPADKVDQDITKPEHITTNRTFFAHNSDVVLNETYTFERFVVGNNNALAHAAARAIADSPGRIYNPFFVHGRVGLGKTHLMQAICHELMASAKQLNILYLSSETFVNQFIGAIEAGELDRFRHKYRNVDVLLVDDIHLLANKERTQEEFFHTFNALYNAGKQIVLSSDSPPSEIPTLKERLISRFKWGLEAELAAPAFETRLAILRRKARDRGAEVPEEVLSLLSEHIDTNIRELEGAITKVIGFAYLIHRQVDLEIAHQALGLQSAGVMRRVTGMDRVADVVCKHFGVQLADLQGRKRSVSVALPRRAAMFLARQLTTLSLEEIGSYFGGRDHSTVMYALVTIRARMQEERSFAQLMADLESRARR